jgi:S-adenosylmethionine-diacylgycerolhomoserine-N-methlytransferase
MEASTSRDWRPERSLEGGGEAEPSRSWFADLKVLYHLTLKPIRGCGHEERLETFYGGQAEAYDRFRDRLLKGRQRLFQCIPTPRDGIWVDLGGGTGENFESLGSRITQLKKAYVVDLSPSLLRVAQQRAQRQGWDNVVTVKADAARFTPDEGLADVVTMSYSLTMTSDWCSALAHAGRILRSGGRLGVVDFYVSRKYPPGGLRRHGWPTRSLLPIWFAWDNVFLSPDHLPLLINTFETERLEEGVAKLPYLPFVHAPYYVFIGKQKAIRGCAL